MNKIEDRKFWFVVRTNRGEECLARDSLQTQGIEVYLPVTPVEMPGPHGRRCVSRPLFPGYLFVRLCRQDERLGAIYRTRGVEGLLKCGMRDDELGVVRQIEAREILSLPLEAPKAAPATFRPGAVLTVQHGPFTHLHVTFDAPIDDRRCWVVVTLFGVSRRAEADVRHLTLA